MQTTSKAGESYGMLSQEIRRRQQNMISESCNNRKQGNMEELKENRRRPTSRHLRPVEMAFCHGSSFDRLRLAEVIARLAP
jgi:hypothetical protein